MLSLDFPLSQARRLFWLTFWGTLLLKIVLAAGFPITGDEAFFYQWGVRPAWGYSDHPPMVGWLLALLHRISDAPLVLRSVTLLVTSIIGLGFAVHILGWRRERWWALALMFATALPSIAVNVAFNATHGWTNVMFNLFNRNEGGHWNLKTPAVYLGMVAYLFTPWLLWQAGRAPRAVGVSVTTRRALAVLWLFPILLFAFISLRRTVGLHWVLGFVPLFVAWAALHLDAAALRRSWRWNLWLSGPHLLLVAAIAWAPLSWWQHTKLHERAVFLRETPALVAALQQDLPTGATLMARTYNPAAMLAFHHQQYVPVFGVGRHHARQDDLQVDFRTYDGQTLRIFDYNPPNLADFAPYFERVGSRQWVIDGVAFYAVDGVGFRYQPYRDTVLATIAEQFHQVPPWLPNLGSPFCERYGFVGCSPGQSKP